MNVRVLTIILALCMLIGLMAGCAESDPTPSPSADPQNTGSIADPSDNSQKEDRKGGEITIPTSMFISSMVPWEVTAKGGWVTMEPAIEHLGRLNLDGSVTPFLAEEFIEDAENNTLTIKLREGIKFSDGSDFNADVLVWTLEQFIASGKDAEVCSPSKFEATDEYTVVMYFDSYANDRLETLSQVHIMSQKAFEENGGEWAATNPIGTGAFVVESYELGHSIVYAARDDYWQDGLPYLDKITFMLMTDTNTQLTAFINGELDIFSASTGAHMAQVEALTGVKKISSESGIRATQQYFLVNSVDENSPFSDVRVRRAFYMGLDRDSSAVALTEGLGYGVDQYISVGIYGHLEDDELYSTYDYDVEAAKALLAEAGYPDGFSCELLTRPQSDKQAVAMQSYAVAIGIDAEIRTMELNQFNTVTKEEGFSGIAIGGGGIGAMNPGLSLSRLVPRWEKATGGYDKFPEWKTLLDDAALAVGQENIETAYKAVGYFLNEQLPVMGWYDQLTPAYAKEELQDSNYQWAEAYSWTPEMAYLAK